MNELVNDMEFVDNWFADVDNYNFEAFLAVDKEANE